MSGRGYGIFIHHASRIIYELGQPALQSAAFRVEDPYLDYFFVYGPTPKEMIQRYTELTGRPLAPPLWSFGAWFSRCMYRDREQVEGIVERLRELAIPRGRRARGPALAEGAADRGSATAATSCGTRRRSPTRRGSCAGWRSAASS